MFKSSLIILLLLVISGCHSSQQSSSIEQNVSQATIDQIANTLQVRYTILENRGDGHCLPDLEQACYRAKIELTSPQAITGNNWGIYFSVVDRINQVVAGEFSIDHINGDLNRIYPTDSYTPFTAGETKTVEFIVNGLNLTEARMMPNYYVAANDLQARTIESTRTTIDPETGLEIRPYATDLDWQQGFKRAQSDNTQLATSGYLYAQNQDTQNDQNDLDIAIIPTPKKVTRNNSDGQLDLAKGLHINSTINPEAISFALSRLEMLGVTQNTTGIPVDFILAPADKPSGTYSLKTANNSITITAADNAGASHALISLAALIIPGNTSIPSLYIEDEPRYPFRGMHIDVARNFHSKQLLIDLMDQMAAYKLNKLHLHLGEDEAWRLEINDLPELTDIGSKRCHDPKENTCLIPQLGSGATPHSTRDGYYSKADYLEILRAASARHIQVIPSFDMPGHSRAAVKSMEARYRKYMDQGDQAEAERYLLTDFNDTTEYRSIQHYNDNTINVCMDSSYAFIEKVLDEVQALHAEANHPLTRYHIGADETAGAWLESPVCKTFLKNHDLPTTHASELGGYFIERIAALLHAKGIEPAGWSDGMAHPGIKNMPEIVQSNLWGTLYDHGHKDAHAQLNRGWQVVLSTPDVLYYDFPYETDPKEAGYNWASRHTNTRKAFEFMPDNLPIHAEFWRDSQDRNYEIDDRLTKDNDGVITHQPIKKGLNFLGIQGHLWSETIRSDEQVEYQIFPRMLGLAERAWHTAEWEVPYNYEGALYNKDTRYFTDSLRAKRDQAWNSFANTLGHKELAKLDQAGIFYRIPTVGAKIEEGRLYANLIFPGLAIQYKEAGGQWQDYQSPVDVTEQVEVRALSADGSRKGRSLKVDNVYK